VLQNVATLSTLFISLLTERGHTRDLCQKRCGERASQCWRTATWCAPKRERFIRQRIID